MTIERVAQKTAHAPATLFDVAERGFIREGYHADLTVIDPNRRTVVDAEPVYAKCGWTPFRGTTFHSRVTHTFVGGAADVRRRRVPRRHAGAGVAVRPLSSIKKAIIRRLPSKEEA